MYNWNTFMDLFQVEVEGWIEGWIEVEGWIDISILSLIYLFC